MDWKMKRLMTSKQLCANKGRVNTPPDSSKQRTPQYHRGIRKHETKLYSVIMGYNSVRLFSHDMWSLRDAKEKESKEEEKIGPS
jgi:hypothetical protein